MDDVTLAKTAPITVWHSKLRVSVVAGPDQGRTREVVNATLRIGSASDNDLVLNDATVSRHHCSVESSARGVRVRDEGSTNGVFLGKLQIVETLLSEPADLVLGDTVLRIEPLGEKANREQLVADRFGDLIGRSERMRELFAELLRIAQTDTTLLIEGETGTGKELVADAVHRASRRASAPFVVFDCSAIVSTLIESELFGSVKGAFNGAVDRPGVFEQAHGGTIFLDELGELPKDLQPKLLRVLESRTVKRLGDHRVRKVDVRVISATNRNLAAEVQRGNFREDLFFRLATTEVHVPPLRDRLEDLPLLVDHLLARADSELRVAQLPPAVWAMFQNHRWPGNVRELWNAVQRLLISPDRVVLRAPAQSTAAARPPTTTGKQALLPLRLARREASDEFEEKYVHQLMELTGGDRKAAALMADVSREMIRKLLLKHGLE